MSPKKCPQLRRQPFVNADGESICFALGRRRKLGCASPASLALRLADISAVTKNKKNLSRTRRSRRNLWEYSRLPGCRVNG